MIEDDPNLIDIRDLKDRLAEIELFELFDSEHQITDISLMLFRFQNVKLKIYQEKGHQIPHIHIDLGSQRHVASYGIDPPICLAGSLGKKYDRAVLKWIESKQRKLLKIWEQVRNGIEPTALIASL